MTQLKCGRVVLTSLLPSEILAERCISAIVFALVKKFRVEVHWCRWRAAKAHGERKRKVLVVRRLVST